MFLKTKKRLLNCYAKSIRLYSIEFWMVASQMRRRRDKRDVALEKEPENAMDTTREQRGSFQENTSNKEMYTYNHNEIDE